MSIRIEEAYNDCLERMLSGETLESCLSSYPEYADELYAMLYATYDIKRKASPIQPRPEFKYWARARLQNAQDYGRPPQTQGKQRSHASGLRPKLAISLAAILMFIVASSGTVAASAAAMPDEPLYPVKLAVEQVQVTLTASELDKAKLYAQLAEKRAQEIATMTTKGDVEKVVATSAILSRHLQQLEVTLAKLEAEEAAGSMATEASKTPAVEAQKLDSSPEAPLSLSSPPAATFEQTPSSVSPVPPAPQATPVQTPSPTPAAPQTPPSSTHVTSPTLPAAGATPAKSAATDNITPKQKAADTQGSSVNTKQSKKADQRASALAEVRKTVSSSTTKSLSILQEARDKAPESLKSNLNSVIDQTKNTNKRVQGESIDSSPNKQNMHDAADKDKNEDGNSDKPVVNPSSKQHDVEEVSPGRLGDNDNFNIDKKAVR